MYSNKYSFVFLNLTDVMYLYFKMGVHYGMQLEDTKKKKYFFNLCDVLKRMSGRKIATKDTDFMSPFFASHPNLIMYSFK